ncbi:MAG TPA: hypothetical protein DIS94_07845, partial [Bacteroidetes bacterium]|nr:hypothetical protein [Bacteroidota bacterium]
SILYDTFKPEILLNKVNPTDNIPLSGGSVTIYSGKLIGAEVILETDVAENPADGFADTFGID